MKSPLPVTISLGIAILSSYTLYYSAQSIPKLRKYESKAEKAAKWSNIAEDRLWQTRYTVAAGFVMTLLSLASSLWYALRSSKEFVLLEFLWVCTLAVAELRTSDYLRSFWAKERKVPLLDDYNDAISDMVTVMDSSATLGSCWAVLALLKLFGI